MRFLVALLLLLATTIGLIYHYGGIKLGLVTVNNTRMWNVTGETSYSYLNGSAGVDVEGECTSRSGTVILRLISPEGEQVGGQQCPKGHWRIRMADKDKIGVYQLKITYLDYFGTLDIKVQR